MPCLSANMACRILIAVLLVAISGSLALPADDAATVEKFLSRLGLVDLQTRHLEGVVDTLPAGEERRRLAERLADLYSTQLIEHSEDKSAYDQVLQRIHRLIERVPEARTASLEVMLLQADYFRAETLMAKWIADRTDTRARDEAAQILANITPQLDRRQQQLQAALDKMTTALDAAEVDDDQAVQLREWNRLQAVAGRAAFFAAWSNYYLGLAQPAGISPADAFQRSRDIFRRILGVDGKYAELDASGLGLESIWRARSLIGLGLAEAATGNLAESNACFDLLDRSPAPAEVRELSPYWRVLSLLNAGRVAEAVAFAEPVVTAFTGAPSQGKVSFCVSLVRAGFGGPTSPSAELRQLGLLGIKGLIKLRQLGIVRQLMEKHTIPLDAQPGFHLAWLQGQQKLSVAEKTKLEEDYAAAEQALAAALTAPDVNTDLAGASQCRYQQAWCLYKSGQLENAARTYERALEGLRATDAKTAADAAWMAFLCYHSLARQDTKYVQPAVSVLRTLQREFPDHPYAKRAEYYAGKLQQAALPTAETIANLERVPTNSPDYLAARFGICQLLYEEWLKAGGEKAGQSPRLLQAVDAFLAAAQTSDDDTRKLRAALIGADVALQQKGTAESTAIGIAEKYLDTAREWVNASDHLPLAAEYHYRSLVLATRRHDNAARRSHAEWIVQNAGSSAFELPALVVVAKALDEQLGELSTASREQLQEGLRVYERLVEHFGDDPASLQSKKNAQVALSRFTQYAAALGQHGEALAGLSSLLAAFPNDPSYLRRAGLAAFHSGNQAAALEHWRKLVAGLPKNSDAWYEAKYYQLASLAEVDRGKAREALAQYRLLFPDFGPPAWRGKFAELQQRVE